MDIGNAVSGRIVSRQSGEIDTVGDEGYGSNKKKKPCAVKCLSLSTSFGAMGGVVLITLFNDRWSMSQNMHIVFPTQPPWCLHIHERPFTSVVPNYEVMIHKSQISFIFIGKRPGVKQGDLCGHSSCPLRPIHLHLNPRSKKIDFSSLTVP